MGAFGGFDMGKYLDHGCNKEEEDYKQVSVVVKKWYEFQFLVRL